MPYSILKNLPKPFEEIANSQGVIMYLSQSNEIIASVPLIECLECKTIIKNEFENLLFVAISRILNNNHQDIYSRLNLSETLHVRLERKSDSQKIYDSSELGLSERNPSLFTGTSEKSLLSYVETQFEFFEMQQNNSRFDPDGLYRSCLHLGIKPNKFSDWVSHAGSKLWHALYSEYFPFRLRLEHIIEDCTVPF